MQLKQCFEIKRIFIPKNLSFKNKNPKKLSQRITTAYNEKS